MQDESYSAEAVPPPDPNAPAAAETPPADTEGGDTPAEMAPAETAVAPAPEPVPTSKTVRIATTRPGLSSAAAKAMSQEMRARRARQAQESATFHAVLKSRLWLLTLLVNVTCAIALVCAYLLRYTDTLGFTLFLLGILTVDFALLGFLVSRIYRYYRIGQETIAEHRKQQRREQARKLVEKFFGKRNRETGEKLLQLQATAEARGEETETEQVSEAMFLRLKGDELSNALQFLCMTSRRGHLAMTFEDGRKGDIYLGEGTIKHAEIEGKSGLEAVALMLRESGSEVRFFEGRRWPRETLGQSVSQILIEASVMGDEMDEKAP